ncbi:hypothetical protein ElyMa_001155600 [Elysia marginata]|uniref:Uncharacterized protein n=1 Tax=Elysia marginata TaxID=1093978 RepID=A0AAV4I190_9GAST|nr:hypothetical protein ElyMa_001155600 [Elysia marginata]
MYVTVVLQQLLTSEVVRVRLFYNGYSPVMMYVTVCSTTVTHSDDAQDSLFYNSYLPVTMYTQVTVSKVSPLTSLVKEILMSRNFGHRRMNETKASKQMMIRALLTWTMRVGRV